MVTLDVYEGVVLRDNQSFLSGQDDAKHTDQIRAMIELLGFWAKSAQSSSSDNKARQELARAVTSGHLITKIDAIKAGLETSPNTDPMLLDRIRGIEREIQYVV